VILMIDRRSIQLNFCHMNCAVNSLNVTEQSVCIIFVNVNESNWKMFV